MYYAPRFRKMFSFISSSISYYLSLSGHLSRKVGNVKNFCLCASQEKRSHDERRAKNIFTISHGHRAIICQQGRKPGPGCAWIFRLHAHVQRAIKLTRYSQYSMQFVSLGSLIMISRLTQRDVPIILDHVAMHKRV